MTLQKAMRIRSNLKKEIARLSELIHKNCGYISYANKIPTDVELAVDRAERPLSLDGMSYEEILKKIFIITDAIQNLNVAIENKNQEGHNLLFKETAIKSKLAMIDYQIERERKIIPAEEDVETDYEHQDEKGNYRMVKVTTYNFSMLPDEAFDMSLVDYRKKLSKDLEAVRDELSAFNAISKIDYELPAGIL